MRPPLVTSGYAIRRILVRLVLAAMIAALLTLLSLGSAANAAQSTPVVSAPVATAANVVQTSVVPTAVETPMVAPAAKPSASSCEPVKPGGTLGKMANAHGMSLKTLLAINPQYKKNPNLVHPGNQVCFSGSATPVAINATATKAAPAPAAAPAAPPNSKLAQVTAFVRNQVGKPYLWGGNGPNAFDCSGLIVAAFKSVGINLPRVASAMYSVGKSIDRADLRPGDLVFFGPLVSEKGHVGFYVGNNQMIDAPGSGQSIGVHNLYNNYVGAKRNL